MYERWLVIVPIVSMVTILLGIKCLLRYNATQSRQRRDEALTFPWRYHATGFLSLPYDDIVEPFEAWYAGDINMSRIDYYNGMDKTIQRGDLGEYGEMFKIIPMHSGIRPSNDVYISCWYKPLPKWMHRKPQTVVPNNLSEFKMSGEEEHQGQLCYKFTRLKIQFNKTNTYILYVTARAPHKPLRFEMIGYDEMMTSHYDHYILDYTIFEPWKLNKTAFNVPKKITCTKKKRVASTYILNPMAEFMHFSHAYDKELEKAYHSYKTDHKKSYRTRKEHEAHKHIYKHNLRFIHSKNRRHLKYVLKPNHLTDLSDEEVRLKNGLLHEPHTKSLTVKHFIFNLSLALGNLPANLDWRDYGAVSPVHSQGMCGSCWTFSVLGAVEAMNFFKTRKLIELSKQQLLDCSWGVGNHGCRGGFQARTLRWIKKNGVATKTQYGKYLAQEGMCHCGNCTVVNIDGFMHVKKHNPILLKIALATHGPIASSLNADLKTFRFYSHGIYDDVQCKKITNHAVLTIGYGNETGTSYWLIQNSWGPLWGDGGYIKIASKNDICGTTSGSLIAIKKSKDVKEFPFKYLKKIPWKDERLITDKEMMEPFPFT